MRPTKKLLRKMPIFEIDTSSFYPVPHDDLKRPSKFSLLNIFDGILNVKIYKFVRRHPEMTGRMEVFGAKKLIYLQKQKVIILKSPLMKGYQSQRLKVMTINKAVKSFFRCSF